MTMMSKHLVYTQEQVRWLELRGWVYRLLMDFLSRPPRMSLIAQWRQKVEQNNRVPESRGGQRLKSYLESISEEDFRRVCYKEAEEYERLFMGHDAILASCESIVRCRAEGADAFSCISEVGKMYTDSGIVFNKLNGERDDHIALELEFMAVLAEEMLSKENLCYSCLELADAQIKFLEDHLLKWAPEFAAELLQVTTSPLYKGLAELLQEFLPSDLQQLRRWRTSQRLV